MCNALIFPAADMKEGSDTFSLFPFRIVPCIHI